MSLSSLIVQREIATIREIEEALARQVLYGGDLVTNLFEVSRVDEDTLMEVVGEAYGLTAVPAGELAMAPPNALRMIAPEVVNERSLFPLEIGSSLIVAVAEPLSRDAEQELSFALALPIEQRLAPLFRIRQALARDYGIPLDKRIARLLQKLVANAPRVLTSMPPAYHSAGAFRPPPRPPSAMPPPPPSIVEAPRTELARQGTLVRKDPVELRPQRRRRGPLTAEEALGELEASAERDAIFDVLFDFARQFFDYTALFVVHGDIAEGRDAFGDGAPRDKVARIGVPLESKNMLAAARAKRELVRARPLADGLDPVLMADLERSGGSECVVFPIIVRKRVVGLIFGDGGISGIDDIGVRQVEKILESAGGAFERVIMRRKLKGSPVEGGAAQAKRNAESLPPPPTQVSAPPVHESSLDDLAAPIRELLESGLPEPVSPPRPGSASALLALDPSTRSDRPPPENLLAVRRPSGRPIPREDPISNPAMPAAPPSGQAPGSLRGGPASRQAPGSLRGGPVSAPGSLRGGEITAPRTRSQSLQRAAAPPLFGSTAETNVVTSSGRSSEAEPRTTRDASWLDDEPMPHSPKASSPPPMRAVPVTDVSPQPLPFPPAGSVEVRANPFAVEPRRESPQAKLGTQTLVAGHSPLPMAPAPEPERKLVPITPIVVLTPEKEFTPEPPPPKSEHGSEPVLKLSHRKGEPPELPKQPEPKKMPLSEEKVSVPLHKPPSSRSDHSRVLPSVIVDVASEYVTLVERVLDGPDDAAEADLLRAGGYAMPAIMERFPGPLEIESDQLEAGPLPRVGECGPILRLIAVQRRTALPFVLSHVQGADVEKRFWATYLLTELAYPESIDPAIARSFDEDPRVRRAARAALRVLAELNPEPVVERLGEIAFTQALTRRLQALEALAETREPLAVPVLLPLLEDVVDGIAQNARAALVLITQQDFGTETEKWLSWWASNRDRHRLEWLIDSLMHDQRAIRSSSSEELRTITKEFFAYYDDLPKRERLAAQTRYREWWDQIGRVRFSKASARGA